ncbi:MAG TPA: hypothetical protein VND94_22595 [Terriglobia bacterium]|nr:hypothetical protein [Terriglobia bacterium]
MPPAQRDSIKIDQFYLRTVQLLKEPGGLDEDDVRRLTREVDALPSSTEPRDPCLAQKRRQLLPILISLAVIDGISDAGEQQALRAEALHRLLNLASPPEPIMDGDLCFGRGFPPVMMGSP